MPKVNSPFLFAYQRLVKAFGITVVDRQTVVDFLAEDKGGPLTHTLFSWTPEELMESMMERQWLAVIGDKIEIRKRMVVHYKDDPYDVFIGRGSPWGNPFIVGVDGDRMEVIGKFKEWVESDPVMISKVKMELKGKVLGCYCSPLPCHGDILTEIANEE